MTKELIKLEKLRHENSMKEIETEKLAKIEVEKLKFDHMMQLQRVKSAEIRKSIERRNQKHFMENYSK